MEVFSYFRIDDADFFFSPYIDDTHKVIFEKLGGFSLLKLDLKCLESGPSIFSF